jgi:predicted GIY-YIG superfamily endonuclease
MTCGIYALDFDGVFYIGKSIHIENRYKEHCAHLLKKNHHSKKVQSRFTYTGRLPTLLVLETVSDLTLLNELEISYISEFDSYKNGLNSTIGGEGTGYGEYSPLSIHSNEDIIKVFILLVDQPELTQAQISNITSVAAHTINKISSCTKHTWLNIEFPEKYALLKNSVGKRISNRSSHPLVCSPEGEIHEILSIREFARLNNIDPSALCNLLKGKRKSANKWKLA